MALPRDYRTDVDGLRGLAVLLVLLYHLRVPGFGGGFVGVDVFFVISGFVVTRMLRTEMAAGTFTFKRFYVRRFWRLQPAFFLVALTTLAAASVLLAGDDLYRAARSALAALTFSANFYFWRSTAGYATPLAETEPFLHTWSLAVEEQFYLLWPALLWLGARARILRHPLSQVGMLAGLLALSQWLAAHEPSVAYYLLPARLVELGLGALIVKTEPWRVPRAVAEGGALVGLAGILAASALLDQRSVFPGFLAMLPCVGTALLIQAGTARPLLSRLFESRGAVLLGRISYSYYLWHWPAIAFLNYAGVELTWPVRLSVAVGSLVLSAASYRFWEIPTRAATSLPTRRLAVVVGVCLLASIGLTIRPGAKPQLEAMKVEERLGTKVNYRNLDCLFAAKNFRELDACDKVKARPGAKRVLLWGDSHAREWGKNFRAQAKALNIIPTTLSIGGCPPLFDIHRADKSEQGKKCDEALGERIQAFLARHKFDVIIVVARFGIYERGWIKRGRLVAGSEHFVSDSSAGTVNAAHSAEVVHRKLPETLRYLTGLHDTKIVFVLPTPELPVPANNRDKEADVAVSRADYLSARAKVLHIVQKFSSSLVLFDAIDALCDQQSCHAMGPNGRLYWDDNHLSNHGMARLLPLLKPLFAD